MIAVTYSEKINPSDLLVVCAEHPEIGYIFWYFVYEGDVNMPDHYGLTVNHSMATRLKPALRKANNRVTSSFIWHIDYAHYSISELIRNTNLTTKDLFEWAVRAEWVERFVTDDNSFEGDVWG